jgi:hypothetical protein
MKLPEILTPETVAEVRAKLAAFDDERRGFMLRALAKISTEPKLAAAVFAIVAVLAFVLGRVSKG